MAFVSLHSPEELSNVIERSAREPVVLFKHSRTCGLSASAYREMERLTAPDDPPVYLVVVQTARGLSDEIEARLAIRHESPQVIVLSEAQPVFHTSHRGVTAEAVREASRTTA